MKERHGMLIALLLCSPQAAADAPKLEQFNWLAGCWAFERDGKRYEEVWLPPAGDGAMGMARTLKDGKTVNDEFTRLVVRADGRIAYVANPSGQSEATFPLLSLEGTHAVFENAAHDFPNRVIYTYTAPDRLDARVEGALGGKAKAFDYPFRRASCGPH